MTTKKPWPAPRPWRSDHGHFLRTSLVLAIVALSGAGIAQAEEPKSELVLVTSPTEVDMFWALCLRQKQGENSAGICYSPIPVSTTEIANVTDESTVKFKESWSSWLQELAGRDISSSVKNSRAQGRRDDGAKQPSPPSLEEIEIFEAPRRDKQLQDYNIFRRQVQVIVKGVSRGDLDAAQRSSSQLLTADELRSLARRKSDWPRFLISQLEQFRLQEPDFVGEVYGDAISMAVILGLGLLPLASVLIVIRIRTGSIPTISDLRDAVKYRNLLGNCESKLDTWMKVAGEQSRKKDGLDHLMDKLELALERLQGLQDALNQLLGYKVGLASLYTDLAGRIAGLSEAGKTATLQGIFDEVRDLRRLRNALEKRETRSATDGEDLERWIGRITERLENGWKIDDALRSMGAGGTTDPLADLKLLCDSARKFASERSRTLEELPSILDRARTELDRLVSIAKVDAKGSAETQIQAIYKKWEENAENAARVQLDINEKRSEINRCQEILREIADALPEPRDPVDHKLIEDVAQLAKKCRGATISLKPWSGESHVDRMATELDDHLKSLERDFFPAGGGGGPGQWHERLRDKLQRSKELTTKLERMEGVARTYLGFEPGHEIEEILRRESQQPHRVLRLRILSALDQDGRLGRSPQDEKILDVLRLRDIQDKASLFLKRLGAWPDAPSLWEKGIASGFGDQWLHNLLRAALVLETYYKDSDVRERFGWVCALAEAFQQSLKSLGKSLSKVQLLATPDPAWTQLRKTSTLVRLSEVWEKVSERRDLGGGFVVDVERFALPGIQHIEECHVILFNPADWDPSQERRK